MPIQPTGPHGAKIMLVGEFPHEADILRSEPFVGGPGFELTKMLMEAGIPRESIRITMVCRDRAPGNRIEGLIPARKKDVTPQHIFLSGKMVMPAVVDGITDLKREIESQRPNVVCALGNLALWALTNQWGAGDWRSSVMESTLVPGLKVIPTISPAIIMHTWSQRPMLVHDLKRVKRESASPEIIRKNYKFVIRPDYPTALAYLESLILKAQQHQVETGQRLKIAGDIETRAGHISCIGFAQSATEAICIPFMTTTAPEGYWTLEEEASLVHHIYQLCQLVTIIGQNWNYDAQYIHRHWHFLCPSVVDTMIQQHSCFSNLPKNLAFLSSMYLDDHLYWKDDRTNWTEGPSGEGENQYWIYNCTDCIRTYAIHEVLNSVVKGMKLEAVNDFQQALAPAVLRTMNRGLRVDTTKRAEFSMLLQDEVAKREAWMTEVLGSPINIRSPAQMADFFYRQMGQREVINRKTHSVTCNDEALHKIAAREPILLPVTRKIAELRSLGVFHSTFVQAPLDIDGRMRTSFNVCGTETYRFASSQNAFGTGMNLQNIPKGGETEDGGLDLPNVRTLFIPDPGHTFFDIDLDSADLRIVTWESGCEWMKDHFKNKRKPYVEVMREYYHDNTMTKASHPREYAMFKSLCHGCVTAGHEVLTQTGWVKVEDYDKTLPLMVWDKNNWKASFEVPKDFFIGEGNHFIHLTGQSYDTEVTHDHRVPYTVDSKDDIRVRAASELPYSARIPMCGYLDGEVFVEPAVARLLAAFQADGTVDQYGNVLFHFHRSRKIERMHSLLAEIGVEHTWNGKDRFYIPHREASLFSAYGKVAGSYLLSWSGVSLDAFLDELQHWDGSASGTIKCHVTTVHKEHADWLQTVAKLRGFGSQVNVQREAEGNRQTLYRVSLNNRQFFNLGTGAAIEEKVLNGTRSIYCPITSTGFFFIRRNGKIGITGNTNYLGTADGIAPRIGLNVHETERIQKWYYEMCPEIKKWQDDIKRQVSGRRYVENVFGYRNYFFDRIEGTVFNQAVAWIPQSSVGCLINRAYLNIDRNLPEVEVLLQVHDSLAGQFESVHGDWALRRIVEEATVPLPYPGDPLIIPVGVVSSNKSWGDCG